MSDFDANPFADPQASNPFSDPSVKQATQPRTAGMEEYNPFADSSQGSQGYNTVPQQAPTQPPASVPPPQPAVMHPTQDPPPPYSGPTAAQQGTEDLKRRQEELERKAAELQRKEQELQRNLQFQNRKNNFPPLPEKCCVQPCFYQDFELDIPLEFQRIVKIMYYLWIAYVALLFLNMIVALAYFIVSSSDGSGGQVAGTTFGVSILYLLLFTPCSFLCWYRPVYKAFRSDSSFNFFFFFFIFFFQFCACIIFAVGMTGWGSVGLINGLGMVNAGTPSAIAIGLIMVFVGVLFGLLCLAAMIMLIKVHKIYRSTGASFAKAQEEFATGVMSNKTVQNTAANAGQAAMRGAMNSSTQGDNRY